MALPNEHRDDDLRALAQDTRAIAALIDDSMIRRRLIDIADEILVVCGSEREYCDFPLTGPFHAV